MAMLATLLDIILPRVCLLCGSDAIASGLCADCDLSLVEKKISSPLCTICGEPFPDSSGPDHACGICLTRTPPFTSARSALAYGGAVLDAVHRFKYSGEVNLARPLGRLAAGALPPLVPHVIVPVPLHPGRLRERGFNQSLLLSRELSKILNAPVDYASLRRVRQTEQQSSLTAEERKKNVAGAFGVIAPGAFNWKTVLLVDDVYTTGATVMECARALKKDGATVAALTLARALKV